MATSLTTFVVVYGIACIIWVVYCIDGYPFDKTKYARFILLTPVAPFMMAYHGVKAGSKLLAMVVRDAFPRSKR